MNIQGAANWTSIGVLDSCILRLSLGIVAAGRDSSLDSWSRNDRDPGMGVWICFV
jgi:hypothetical protein